MARAQEEVVGNAKKAPARRPKAGGRGHHRAMTTVRSYVLAPVKRITDHRTGREQNDPQAVLDGQLDGFIGDAIRLRAERRRDGIGGRGGALKA